MFLYRYGCEIDTRYWETLIINFLINEHIDY